MPADPESKGGSEATVKIAKADLVPTAVNLRDQFDSFAELRAATGCVHGQGQRPAAPGHTPQARSTCWPRSRRGCIRVPADPYVAALGETRVVTRES